MDDRPWAIEVRGLSRWFGPVTALDHVDLFVPQGTVHGLLGANGAGKTTLLSILLGLVSADEGDVRLFGRTRGQSGRGWLDGVGSSVEVPHFYPHLTARQNLRALARLDDVESGAQIDAALRRAGLAEVADTKVRGFSLGMQQRLGLAGALIREPQLLVLDEPANGLDPTAARDLTTTIRDIRGAGGTVLLSSHDMGQVDALCDAVTVLSHGTVAFSGSLATLREAAPAPSWHVCTSDDAAALELARNVPGLLVERTASGTALQVFAPLPVLEEYVMVLGQARTAVRELWQARSPLALLFDRLTEDSDSDSEARV